MCSYYYCSAGDSTELQFKVNTGSYELPLFKPPLCKVADAESDVSATQCTTHCTYRVTYTTAGWYPGYIVIPWYYSEAITISPKLL